MASYDRLHELLKIQLKASSGSNSKAEALPVHENSNQSSPSLDAEPELDMAQKLSACLGNTRKKEVQPK